MGLELPKRPLEILLLQEQAEAIEEREFAHRHDGHQLLPVARDDEALPPYAVRLTISARFFRASAVVMGFMGWSRVGPSQRDFYNLYKM